MPATYRIDPDREIVFSIYSGHLTDVDVLGHQDRLRADGLFQPHFRQLFDSLNVETVEVGVETIRKLAQGNPFGTGARRAMVTDNALIFGYTRMFEILVGLDRPDEFDLFSDMAEARSWLGLA
jgi:hypothetical protein